MVHKRFASVDRSWRCEESRRSDGQREKPWSRVARAVSCGRDLRAEAGRERDQREGGQCVGESTYWRRTTGRYEVHVCRCEAVQSKFATASVGPIGTCYGGARGHELIRSSFRRR